MTIRKKLATYFTAICATVLLLVFLIIYFVFYYYFHNDFYTRLEERAGIAANLYLEADEISSDSLKSVRKVYLAGLPEEDIRIYDSKNNHQFISDQGTYWNNQVIEDVREKGYLQFKEGNRQAAGIHYADNQGNFVIIVSAVDIVSEERLKLLRQIMIPLFLVVTTMLYIAGIWFARKALSPITSVMKQVQQIRSPNLHLRVQTQSQKDEIAELAMQFNQLLEHLENAFAVQKNFAANASHELRTPLTSMIGQIEVVLSKQRQTEEYTQTLQSVLTDATKLKDTVAVLIELAYIENGLQTAEHDIVRVDDLLWELQEEWNAKLPDSKLELLMNQLPENESQLQILANSRLLAIAINNIIRNAFKFSDGAKVICSLTVENDNIRISIKDSGIGIELAAIPQLFQPFYRAKNADAYPGSGLGLYMANKIVQTYKGHIHIDSVPGQYSELSIIFSNHSQAIN